MTTTNANTERRLTRSPGVGARLLLAQALVLLAGGATTWIVAVIVGPPLFREHLRRAGVAHQSNEQFHAEQAYRYATAISIAVAIGVAALTALLVTWYFSRRLQRSSPRSPRPRPQSPMAAMTFACHRCAWAKISPTWHGRSIGCPTGSNR